MISDVAVLYVDPRGPYPSLVTEWYDEARDARTYRGSLPVVAHPPCGPWGRLAHLSRKHAEIAFAPHAVAVVQRCGGVLEHPAHSALWGALGLPLPADAGPERFARTLRDAHGGYTLEVAQCDWGHVARKRTWLYVVGCPFDRLPAFPPAREPTHWITGGRGREGRKAKTTPVPPGIKVCSARQRRRTPPAFAEWLITIARSVHRKEAAA